MISKISISLLQKNSTKLKKVFNSATHNADNSIFDTLTTDAFMTNIISKNSKKPFSKISLFFTKLKDKIVDFFRKIFKNKKVKKNNQPKIKIDNADDIQKRIARDYLNNNKVPKVIKDKIETALREAERNINIETGSYTTTYLEQLKNANKKAEEALAKCKETSFKGYDEQLDVAEKIEERISEHNPLEIRDKFLDLQYGRGIEEKQPHSPATCKSINGIEFKISESNSQTHHLAGESSTNVEYDTSNLYVEDKFNDLLHGKTNHNVKHNTESSLFESIESNHSLRNDIEQHVDNLMDNTHIDDFEDNLEDLFL